MPIGYRIRITTSSDPLLIKDLPEKPTTRIYVGDNGRLFLRRLPGKPDITKTRWPQTTFSGRANHFFALFNPLNILASDSELENSRKIITDYKNGVYPDNLTVGQLWRAMHLYYSALHQFNGRKLPLLWRMSSQVPCNTVITGALLSFYKSTPAVVGWQCINQPHNAIFNYCNRSGESLNNAHFMGAYCLATSFGIAVALGLHRTASKMPPIWGRLMPFASVVLANCFNIPMMRQRELIDGLHVYHKGKPLGKSRKMARRAAQQVTTCRIATATPAMVCIPLLINHLVKKQWFYTRQWWLSPLLQTVLCGVILTISTPLGCALYPQWNWVNFSDLEPELQWKIVHQCDDSGSSVPKRVCYNRGL